MAQDYTKILNNHEVITWAKQYLKKRNRIEWYLKLVKEKPTIHPVEPLRHFYSLNLPEIELLELTGSLGQIISKFKQIESQYLQKKMEQGLILVEKSDNVLLQLPDNYAWLDLETSYSPEEAESMGHCGNESGDESETILSLRQKIKKAGRDFWEPVLTFILHEDGLLGEMKGKQNTKPHEKYHPQILALMKVPRIKGLRGGGFLPQKNFYWSDLSEDVLESFFKSYSKKFTPFERKFFPNRKNLKYIKSLEDLEDPALALKWVNNSQDLHYLALNSFVEVAEEACLKLLDINLVMDLIQKNPAKTEILLNEDKEFSEDDLLKVFAYGVETSNLLVREQVVLMMKSDRLWKILLMELNLGYGNSKLIGNILNKIKEEISSDMAPSIVHILNNLNKKSENDILDWLNQSFNSALFESVYRKLSTKNKIKAIKSSWNSNFLLSELGKSNLSLKDKHILIKELLLDGKFFEKIMISAASYSVMSQHSSLGYSSQNHLSEIEQSLKNVSNIINHEEVQKLFTTEEKDQMKTRYFYDSFIK